MIGGAAGGVVDEACLQGASPPAGDAYQTKQRIPRGECGVLGAPRKLAAECAAQRCRPKPLVRKVCPTRSRALTREAPIGPREGFALSRRPCKVRDPFAGMPNGSSPDRHYADRNARAADRVVRSRLRG